MLDFEPINVPGFNGLWARGRYSAVPPDHLSDCLNIKTMPGGLETRDGFNTVFTIASVKRQWVFKVYGQADRLLILDGSGSLWDSTNLLVPILTIAGMTDFVAAGVSGRAYISPTNGTTGLAGESLYVYNGSGLAYKAGGAAPTGTMTATESATTGNVEAGFRIYAVAYETATGFITAPGPEIFATLTSVGAKKVSLAGIPTGPSDVAARRIIATQKITSYTGNQLGYQFYFVPGGRIADNTTTTLDLSFFDQDLVTDATYLLDLFDNIPAMLWLNTYHGRLIGGGENANPSTVRVSEAGQPEAFNEVDGLMNVDPANTSSPVTNGIEYKDNLYLYKRDRTYATSDNNSTPSTWNTVTIDEGLGTEPHAVATVADSAGVNIDKIFVAHKSGLFIFTGTYSRPEVSWKIRDLWNRINKKYFYTVQVAHDLDTQRIFISAPIDAATSPSHILVCDYSECDPIAWNFYRQVRWYVWTLADNDVPTTIVVETNTTDSSKMFRVGCSTGNVYEQVPNRKDDYSHAIPTPFFQTAVLGIDKGRGVQHYSVVRLNIQGVGLLTTTIYDKDKTKYYNPALTTNLSLLPGQEIDVLLNFDAQGAMLNFVLALYQEYFKCDSVTLFANLKARAYPR